MALQSSEQREAQKKRQEEDAIDRTAEYLVWQHLGGPGCGFTLFSEMVYSFYPQNISSLADELIEKIREFNAKDVKPRITRRCPPEKTREFPNKIEGLERVGEINEKAFNSLLKRLRNAHVKFIT